MTRAAVRRWNMFTGGVEKGGRINGSGLWSHMRTNCNAAKNGFSTGEKSLSSTLSYITMQMLISEHDYHFHKVYVPGIESWSVLVMDVTPGRVSGTERLTSHLVTYSPPSHSLSRFLCLTHTHSHNTNFNKRLSLSIYIIYLWAVTSKVQIVFQALKLQLRDLIHFSSRCSSDKGPLHHIYLRLSMFNAQNNCN